jgi:uncharacterized damage-inducible protein DinB
MVRLEAVLESWKAIRADAAQAVEDFPSEELDFSPLAGMMTFREIAVHILVAGQGLSGLLLEGKTDFTSPDFRSRLTSFGPDIPAPADRALLAGLMRATVETRCRQLAARSPEFYSGLMTRYDGQRVTRLEMLQTVKEHELTHRSQLFLYLRFQGVTPVTTRRKLAAAAAPKP